MNPFIDPQQLRRERSLFRYMVALERGDDAIIAAVLREAETDAQLEAMIFAWHAEPDAEEDALSFAHDANDVQRLAGEHLASGAAEEISDPPPLMVKDIIARLREELQGMQGSMRFSASIMQEAAQFAENTTPLPENLSLGALQRLFAALNVTVSPQFLKKFRDIAIFTAMGRERASNVAAARRQRARKSQKPEQEPQA